MNTTFTVFRLFPLYTFSLTLAIGAGLGLIWSSWPVLLHEKTVRERLNFAAVGLGGALIGGRFGYSLGNWPYYKVHLIEIIQFWLGGFSWLGALVGALTALFITTLIIGISFGETTDGLLPLLTGTGISIGIASWITGYAYGQETDMWYGVPAIDEWGVVIRRLPTQLLGALLMLGWHRLVEIFQMRVHNKAQGTATSIQLAGLALIVLVISPFRADSIPIWREIRMDALSSAVVLTISIISAAYNFGIIEFNKIRSNHK